MNVVDYLKLLWKGKDVANQLTGIKTGYKTLAFWVALLGSLSALVASIQGVLPAAVGVCLVAGLTALYNIVRGLVKSQEAGVKEWWKCTETWVSALGYVATALASIQQGGINPAWFATALTLISAAQAAARDLSHKQPAS